MAKRCQVCDKRCYGNFCFLHKPRKAIPKQSDKEKQYQMWKEDIARPYLISKYGNNCFCCGRSAYPGEKLDIEHTLTKGSRPDLKRSFSNLSLYCRYPCHRNKTDGIKCHKDYA